MSNHQALSDRAEESALDVKSQVDAECYLSEKCET